MADEASVVAEEETNVVVEASVLADETNVSWQIGADSISEQAPAPSAVVDEASVVVEEETTT